MKKLLTLLMALLMLTTAALCENGLGIIGGPDGPTTVILAESTTMFQRALDAGRRINTTFTLDEITGIETTDAYENEIISWLQDVSFSIVQQGDEKHASLRVKDKELLNFAYASFGDDLYLKSNLIGGKTFVIGGGETGPVVERLLDVLAAAGLFSQDIADEYKQLLKESLTLADAEVAGPTDPLMSLEDFINLDFDAIINAVAEIAAKVETLDSVIVPRNCDPAEKAYTLTVTTGDLQKFGRAVIDFIRANEKVQELLLASGNYYTQEQIDQLWALYSQFGIFTEEEFQELYRTLDQELDAAYEELSVAPGHNDEAIITACLGEDDSIVYLTAVMNVAEATDPTAESTEPAALHKAEVTYTRLHTAGGVSHTMNVFADGEGVLTIDFLNGDNAVKGSAILTIDDYSSMTLDIDASWHETETVDQADASVTFKTSIAADAESEPDVTTLSIRCKRDYTMDGVDFKGSNAVTFAFDEVTIGFTVAHETADAAESILTGDVVRPAELDDAAFENWFVDAFNSVKTWLSSLIEEMPSGIQSELLLMMMGF